MNYPHIETYTRLKPSSISGIGVFAIRDIPKGKELFCRPSKFVVLKDSDIKKLRGNIRKLYEDFGIFENGKVYAPQTFESMGMDWYLNHSDTPNCKYDPDSDQLRTVQLIKTDTELTVDYTSFSER